MRKSREVPVLLLFAVSCLAPGAFGASIYSLAKHLIPKSDGGTDSRVGFKVTWPEVGDIQYVADVGPQLYTYPLGVETQYLHKRSGDLAGHDHSLKRRQLDQDRTKDEEGEVLEELDVETPGILAPFQRAVRGMFSFVANVSDRVREGLQNFGDSIINLFSRNQ